MVDSSGTARLQSESGQTATIDPPFDAIAARALSIPSQRLTQYLLRARIHGGIVRGVQLEWWIGPDGKPRIDASVELASGTYWLSGEPDRCSWLHRPATPPAPASTTPDRE